jgi:hypothetical protein
VYKPVALTEPKVLTGVDGVTDQVALVSFKPFSNAENCCVAPAGTVAEVGVTAKPEPAPTVTTAELEVTVPVDDVPEVVVVCVVTAVTATCPTWVTPAIV